VFTTPRFRCSRSSEFRTEDTAVLSVLPSDEAEAVDIDATVSALGSSEMQMQRTKVTTVMGRLVEGGAAKTKGSGKKNDPKVYWRTS
jgi:hypothetical protein